MCTFPTAPPPLAFFWPWQTKWWLAFGLFFGWYVASFLLNSCGRLFRGPFRQKQNRAVERYVDRFRALLLASIVVRPA